MPSYSTGRRGVQYGSTSAQAKGFSVQGANDFLAISKKLKAAGGTGKGSVRNEFHSAIKKAAKPLAQAVPKAAEAKFPHKGGLNKVMAKRKPNVVARTGAKTAGVRLQDKRTDPRMNSQGRIYHPLFGRKGSDVVQIAPEVKGYWDETLREGAPEIQAEVREVLTDWTLRIIRGRI